MGLWVPGWEDSPGLAAVPLSDQQELVLQSPTCSLLSGLRSSLLSPGQKKVFNYKLVASCISQFPYSDLSTQFLPSRITRSDYEADCAGAHELQPPHCENVSRHMDHDAGRTDSDFQIPCPPRSILNYAFLMKIPSMWLTITYSWYKAWKDEQLLNLKNQFLVKQTKSWKIFWEVFFLNFNRKTTVGRKKNPSFAPISSSHTAMTHNVNVHICQPISWQLHRLSNCTLYFPNVVKHF